ncbi:unnamed protein product [Trichogramma brassicae]|uniref:AMP-binding enzyme C-terminal domain-containing protein n=1 Tax=Trichogramma brassicae TaxID=86971 RepID=A0A6H5HXD6_9HYME|nr:unnamed protein product [Trichogramma brassicae]
MRLEERAKNPQLQQSGHCGWLHSGDIAYYKENGEVMIVERLKEIIKCRGHQIAPCEIEHVLMRHPGVMEVVVVSVPHDSDNERPVAIVKRTPGFQVCVPIAQLHAQWKPLLHNYTSRAILNYVLNILLERDIFFTFIFHPSIYAEDLHAGATTHRMYTENWLVDIMNLTFCISTGLSFRLFFILRWLLLLLLLLRLLVLLLASTARSDMCRFGCDDHGQGEECSRERNPDTWRCPNCGENHSCNFGGCPAFEKANKLRDQRVQQLKISSYRRDYSRRSTARPRPARAAAAMFAFWANNDLRACIRQSTSRRSNVNTNEKISHRLQQVVLKKN